MTLRLARDDLHELEELWATIQELREASNKLGVVADRVIAQIRNPEGDPGNGD